ncbi:MAG: 50S ribosomal protein L29 [Spirochaetaceae bacterium]|jgi:large subunit ribosomal protein L29|nr:50S ribosomal protein L29 [Spirochaetaceae bacterium]MDT8299292.1 50S ribosomal protein L29 [Spirochaetaceae bacterium]
MKQTFNELTLEELVAKREELSGKMRDVRFEMVMGHVENPMAKRNIRRQIARLNTMIHEFETGIRKA